MFPSLPLLPVSLKSANRIIIISISISQMTVRIKQDMHLKSSGECLAWVSYDDGITTDNKTIRPTLVPAHSKY